MSCTHSVMKMFKLYVICFVNVNMLNHFRKELNVYFWTTTLSFMEKQGLSNYMILLDFEGDEIAKVIILFAKFHIYRSRVQSCKPSHVHFWPS